MPPRWNWRTAAGRCCPGRRTWPRRSAPSPKPVRPGSPGSEHGRPAMTEEWSQPARAALARFLRERGLGDGHPSGDDLAIARIGDGHSNLTYAVTSGTRRVVI